MGAFDPSFWKTVGLIAALLVLVPIGIKAIELARRGAYQPGETMDDDLLGPIRSAFEAGLMGEEEYRRAREALGLPAIDPSLPRARKPRPRAGPTATDSEPSAPGPSA